MIDITTEVCRFIEAKLKANATISAQIANANFPLAIYYESAGANPAKPYIRYFIESATEDARDICDEINAYSITASLNVCGNSLKQTRQIALAIYETFDGLIAPAGFPNIEDVRAEYPAESFPFDSETKKQLYESALKITFFFVL